MVQDFLVYIIITGLFPDTYHNILPMHFVGFEYPNLDTREDFGYVSRRKKDRLASFQKMNSDGFMVLLKLCQGPKIFVQVSILK